MNSRQEFIVKAIEDTQATIRALDVKLGALLTACLLPFSSLGRIWAHFQHLSDTLPCVLGSFLGITYFLLWFATLYVLIKGLSAIDNPARHVIGAGSPRGSFYRGGLYVPKFIDSFVNRTSVQSSTSLQSVIDQLHSTDDELEAELAFEQMKIVYIREIKIKRFLTAFQISIIWLSVASSSFLISKLYP